MEIAIYVIVGLVVAVVGVRRGLPGFFCSKGYSHQGKGDIDLAERWFLKALRFEEIIRGLTGERKGLAIVRTSLGHLYHAQGRLDEAVDMFLKAIDVYSDGGGSDDLAVVYGSLGKAYLDRGDMELAETALNEALSIYSRRRDAQEAIDTIAASLDLVAESRQSPIVATTYENRQYGFTFAIPPEWVTQRLVEQFVSNGGQVAVSHRTHRATFNVSVGPPDHPALVAQERRARAAMEYLRTVPGLVGTVDLTTSSPLGGETNSACAKYTTEARVAGVKRRRTNGFISTISNGIEYVIQWSAEQGFESQVQGMIQSFTFTK